MKYRQSLGSMRAKSHSPLKTPPIQQHAYILSRKKGAVLYGKASKQESKFVLLDLGTGAGHQAAVKETRQEQSISGHY